MPYKGAVTDGGVPNMRGRGGRLKGPCRSLSYPSG